MRELVVGIMMLAMAYSASAQTYVLKDHRPDSNENILVTYDTLPALVDTFFRSLRHEDLSTIKQFVPDMRYLKSTYDTMNVDYSPQMVVTRQQLLLRGLQKDYKKILKKTGKWNLKLKRLEIENIEYEYGQLDKHNYCYVTMHCFRKKKKYKLKFLAMELLDNWFVADEFYLEWIE